MATSVRALLEGVLDYAGMFPPAQLPLNEACQRYRRYCESPEGWMLGALVCPETQLPGLRGVLARGELPAIPVAVATVLHAADDAGSLRTEGELQLSRALVQQGSTVSVECRLPDAAWVHPRTALTMLARLLDLVFDFPAWRPAERQRFSVWVEVPLRPGPWTRAGADPLGTALQWLGDAPARFDVPWRLKFRTGSLDPADIPTCRELATAIVGCRQVAVPWKATAGLHHPLRRGDGAIGAHAHGFLNLLLASVLGAVHQLDVAQTVEVLSLQRMRDVEFHDDALRWQQHQVSVEQIRQARRAAMASFGSCSFDEPVAALRQLRLL
jgi:hypothetical protein